MLQPHRADFQDIVTVAASGLKAQGERLRVIAENIANANSVGANPGDDPYSRRMILFKNVLDTATGLAMVKTTGVVKDRTAFARKFDPGNPLADKDGYVKMPNVKPLIETIDMHEAQRSYDANMSVIDSVRNMLQRALDLLRG